MEGGADYIKILKALKIQNRHNWKRTTPKPYYSQAIKNTKQRNNINKKGTPTPSHLQRQKHQNNIGSGVSKTQSQQPSKHGLIHFNPQSKLLPNKHTIYSKTIF